VDAYVPALTGTLQDHAAQPATLELGTQDPAVELDPPPIAPDDEAVNTADPATV
jgi:hypothetical protein